LICNNLPDVNVLSWIILFGEEFAYIVVRQANKSFWEELLMKKLTALFCIFVVVFSSQLAFGNVVFSNPYSDNSTNAYSSLYNTTDDYLLHQSFTDYYWDGTYSITDFHFWGTSYDGQTSMEGFTFQIWSDNGGDMPGALVYEEYISGNAGATFEAYNNSYYLDVFKYGFDLGTTFNPVNAGYYWFSVYAHNPLENNWFWAMGDGQVNSPDWQHAYLNDPASEYWYNPSEGDFAFEITSGTVIPEPTTLTLLGLGLIGLAIRRKKK
jgi:PEP-CTERM motif